MPEIVKEKPEKYCLECGEPLGPGRVDRKFCNELCKTSYHNNKRKEPTPHDEFSYFDNVEMPAIKKVYDILLNNWMIIYNLCQYDGGHMPLRDLLGHGFNLKYYTSELKDDDGEVYRFCFDFGYRITEDQQVYIIYNRGEIFIL
jgi:predicted nucleic acid-binding Zn ribbon protein